MTQKPKAKSQPTNFLEALRGLGQDVKSEAKIHIKKMVTQDIPQSLGLDGTLQPDKPLSVDDLAAQKSERGSSSRLIQIKEEERTYYRQVEAQNKQQIISIQNEIKLLAKTAGNLAHEVEIAAAQAPTNPGAYHRNFFEQLKGLIIALRRKVQDSQNWLSVTNSRAKQKGYWGQVAKSGTKFMLSSERYAVTSTG